jgi:hypothetical protein
MQRVPEFFIGLTLMAVTFEMLPQQGPTTSTTSTTAAETSLSPEDEAESYEIYSTVLKVKEPAVLEWAIVQETRTFQMCLEPAPDQQFIYRPMIDDYTFKNRKTTVLQRKFKLSAYTFVTTEAWGKAHSITRNPPTNAQNRTFAIFSAVGFNRDRTRALLCLFANNDGTCYFTVKQEGRWQIDRAWRGGGCGWAY